VFVEVNKEYGMNKLNTVLFPNIQISKCLVIHNHLIVFETKDPGNSGKQLKV
jgi:hypothetical protein